MSTPLSCYFLDEALNDDELRIVRAVLIGPWARFRTGAAELLQRRVPAVLPAPDEHGAYAFGREERAEQVRANLRHAGIRVDCGRQVLWVAPRDADWDAIFQYAIRRETGYAPFVAQRWFVQNGTLMRGMRVVDTDILWRGL